MNTSREYAKFKREFVGPKLTRKQRLSIALGMPCTKDEVSIFYKRPGPEIRKSSLTQEEIIILEKKANWSSYIVERRKKRDKSMPAWANVIEIRNIYKKAKQLTYETGIKHEVDHIIPSNHPLVCGLHVENNLQILTEHENIKKSNSFSV